MIEVENGDKKFTERVVAAALREFGIKKSDVTVSVFFVSAEKIRELNRETRNVDRVTDVLSFQQLEEVLPFNKRNFHDYDKNEDGSVFLGEIFVCPERAMEQAEEYGHSYARETGFLLCHGVLHLLGFDHMTEEDAEIMNGYSEKILQKLKLRRD